MDFHALSVHESNRMISGFLLSPGDEDFYSKIRDFNYCSGGTDDLPVRISKLCWE